MDWRKQILVTPRHWGKRLGDLSKPTLQWWIENFRPTSAHGYQGKQLRAALDCAKVELSSEAKADKKLTFT